MQNNNLQLIGNVNGDILGLMDICKQVGWGSVRRLSIYRIVYLASVLFTFKYPREKNPFSTDYSFIVSLRGPYSDIITKSIAFLISNEFLKEDNEVLSIGNNVKPDLELLPNYKKKREWLIIVIYILGIYGEEKVYDFIFRDPEYQDSYQRNSVKEIDIEKGNSTYKVLMSFKDSFEKTLVHVKMDDQKYLELYFEYLFSKILKGDTL